MFDIDIVDVQLHLESVPIINKIMNTSCSNAETVNSGDVVKFPNVQSNYGIHNLTMFKQTGIFTCEQKGLYMFFTNIVSSSEYGYFSWYLNNSKSKCLMYTLLYI
jgi:hypothetical protein